MEYFPLFVNMLSARVLVFGHGEDALRKVRLLLRTPAEIIIATDQTPDWPEDILSGVSVISPKEADPVLPEASFVIIAEEEDDALRRHILQKAKQAGRLVNVVDQKGWSDFITPSFFEMGQFIGAFSSAGAAPVLAQSYRAQFERQLPDGLAYLFEAARGARVAVRLRYTSGADRRSFWRRVNAGVAAHKGAISKDDARAILLAAFNSADPVAKGAETRFVHMPETGNLDDLTLGAYKALQNCDVVLHSKGLTRAAMDLVRRDAMRIALNDQDINAQIEAAQNMHSEARAFVVFLA